MKFTTPLKYIILSALLTACAHDFDRTVSYVERDRFMGTWYVQAGRFTSFEDNAFNAVEKYQWDEKNKKIIIDFTFNQNSLNGPLKKIPQTAWITNESTNATWKVSPFWPLRFTYLIVALDEANYEWTVIGVPNQKYLWIMSRNPEFSKEKTKEILNNISAIGYSVEDIVYVEHNKK